jgi:hypothetical protein
MLRLAAGIDARRRREGRRRDNGDQALNDRAVDQGEKRRCPDQRRQEPSCRNHCDAMLYSISPLIQHA